MLHTVTRLLLAVLAATGLVIAAPAQASDKDWDTASTVTTGALVLTSLGVPLIKDDDAGALQAGGSVAAAGAVSFLLKSTIHEWRPDGSDDQSFPSGHTSISFAAAASLEKRYGWKIGIPAHVAAAFVGLARVEADKHYWHDVFAGAAIGELSGMLITNKENANVQVFPWVGEGGGGVFVAARF